MKSRLKVVTVDILLFLIFTTLAFLGHYFWNTYANEGDLDYKIHLLIWVMTFIVIISVSVVYLIDIKNIIGFVYLGFVVFKMFGFGYLAYFEPDFKNHIIAYFIIFWIYLLVESILVISLLRKQDKNHIKTLSE
ncbi:MAG: hypothetical protein CSA38_05380 [Flavobacteriales bacterium]|nr:MAG: hypothetical protein CSA38_05380 [Flavobacteriales bacterium]